MSNLAKLKKKAADLEQRRQFDKALAVYEEMLLAQEGSDDADVALLNRVGDLRVRLGRGSEALDAYQRAVELYVERGFLNNAIALCNKILRQDPARAEVHYRLGRISAEKGFRSDARRHFLDYAALMQRSGRFDEAFGALQDFAELSPENADIRLVLAEQLSRHGRTGDAITQLTLLLERYEMERRYGEAEEVAERIRALDPNFAAPVHPEGDAAGDGHRPHSTSSRPHTPSRAANGMPELVLIEPTETGSVPAVAPDAPESEGPTPSSMPETLIRDEALELANDLQVGAGVFGDGANDSVQGASDASEATHVVVELVEGLTATGEPPTEVAAGMAPTGGLTPTLDGFETTGLTTPEAGAPETQDATGTDAEFASTDFQTIELESTDGDADAGLGSAGDDAAADFGISFPETVSLGIETVDAAIGDDVFASGESPDPAAGGIPYLVDIDEVDATGPEAIEPAHDQARDQVREERAAPAASSLPSFLSFADEPAASDDSFINLGDLLRAEDGPRSTRMVTEEKAPTGDEQADFAEMLRKFKQGVAENVDEEDYDSHHDLGVAYREMGLLDEAIAEFQRALRGTPHRARSYEALGQCFLDRDQHAIATSVLQRALAEPGADDQKLVGVLYLLGRAAEAMNQRNEALSYYQRVFAVDIEFADVARRMDMAVQVTR